MAAKAWAAPQLTRGERHLANALECELEALAGLDVHGLHDAARDHHHAGERLQFAFEGVGEVSLTAR